MSSYEKFDKKEEIISRTVEIEENLYFLLEKLSKEKYDASINKLVNASIETLIKTEDLKNYERNNVRLVRTFLIRKSLGLSQLEIAESIGINQSTWWAYEKGKTMITTNALTALARKYNYSTDYILGRSKEKFIKK